MKLLFAHDHIFYKHNGLYYSTGGLSKEMLERYTNCFEEVIVISRQREINKMNKKLTLASTDRVKFVKIPEYKTPKTILNYFDAKKIVSNEVKKCDVIIARLPSAIGNLTISYAKQIDKPFLTEMVACPWDAHWNHSIKGKIIAPYMYFSSKRNVRDSNFVVYVTNEFLQKRYPTKGKSTNCSNVELTEFNDAILERRIDKIKNKSKNEKIIIGTTAAVDVRYKGQQFIIQAIGRLKQQGYTNFEYQLVGNGDQGYLKSIAKKYNVSEQVMFLGSMSHADVFDWLETIDIYTQPSRQEGLPRALIEAMSRAVPAFGARTAGIPELLDEKFIFDNSQVNIAQICAILTRYSKEVMLSQSQSNYSESKKYDKKEIDRKRNSFFEEYKNFIVSN